MKPTDALSPRILVMEEVFTMQLSLCNKFL